MSSQPSLSSMMASCFQLVLEAKVNVSMIIRSHSRVLLNEGQCKWLESRLREAVECAQDARSILSTQRFEQLLRNFYLKVKDVEILVGRCCAEPWLTNAVMFADIEEHFVLKGRELCWFRALFKHVKQGSESGLWLEGVARWDLFEREEDDHMEVLVRELEDNAQEDRAKLRRNLEEVIIRSASVADCSLARYLLNKLDVKSERSKGVEYQAPHVMWKVDPKELEYGKCIGRGATGEVYEVKWLKQPFAMKVFYVSQERIFEQEAAILAVLQHPHILPMVCSSVDSENGNCSLMTELMYEDLHNFMFRRRSVSLPVALDLMLQVAEGMQFLHKKRVIHKDLKASNILVRPVADPNLASEGFVCAKVGDFGLSKTKEESATRSQLTVNIGTTRWMAPELLKVASADETSYSQLCYPFKVDVYSYGITFYEVLTGKSPYHNLPSNTEIKKKVMEDNLRPELPVTCPIGLATLIVKCWDEDAGQRPSFEKICRELRHIKGQVLMGKPSFALEPLSKLYKIVAGERPFISSSCPGRLASFMERSRKMETRPSRQNICNALRHIQGLLFTEGITGREGQTSLATVGVEVGEGLGVLVGVPTTHGKGVVAPAVETMEFGRPVQLPAVAFGPVEGGGEVETVVAPLVQKGLSRTPVGRSSSRGRNVSQAWRPFLDIADSRSPTTSAATRFLVVGKLSAKSSTLVQKVCPINTGNHTMGIEEYKHRSLPLYLYDSGGLDDKKQMDVVHKFVKARNNSWTVQSLMRRWHVALRPWYRGEKDPLSNDRIHGIWFVYADTPGIEWTQLMERIKKYNLPLQIILTHSPGQDPDSDMLIETILANRHYLQCPQKEQIVTYDLATRRNDMPSAHSLASEAGEYLQNPDDKEIWDASQVTRTTLEIKLAARIISVLRMELGWNGFFIPQAHFSDAPKSHSYTLSALFIFKFYCRLWDVPGSLQLALLEKVVGMGAFADEDCDGKFKLKPGTFLPFSLKVAAVILFMKIVQDPTGRTIVDAGYEANIDECFMYLDTKLEDLFDSCALEQQVPKFYFSKDQASKKLRSYLETVLENCFQAIRADNDVSAE